MTFKGKEVVGLIVKGEVEPEGIMITEAIKATINKQPGVWSAEVVKATESRASYLAGKERYQLIFTEKEINIITE